MDIAMLIMDKLTRVHEIAEQKKIALINPVKDMEPESKSLI